MIQTMRSSGRAPSALDWATGIVSRIVRYLANASLILIFSVAGLVVLQVVIRNGWNVGLSWSDELARYFGLSLVFLAVPQLALRRRHIAVEILRDMLTGRPRRLFDILSELCVGAFSILFLIAAYIYLAKAGGFKTPGLGMPNLYFYLPATVGIAALLLVSILLFIRLASGEEIEVTDIAVPVQEDGDEA